MMFGYLKKKHFGKHVIMLKIRKMSSELTFYNRKDWSAFQFFRV